MTGHLLGGAGGIETVFTVKAIAELVAPPTINITDLDENADLDIVRDEPRALPAETPAGPIVALNNSFGFGGHNVVLAVRRA
jgi:3-oxoacyl-[acyl-carrier-protein] synthase II